MLSILLQTILTLANFKTQFSLGTFLDQDIGLNLIRILARLMPHIYEGNEDEFVLSLLWTPLEAASGKQLGDVAIGALMDLAFLPGFSILEAYKMEDESVEPVMTGLEPGLVWYGLPFFSIYPLVKFEPNLPVPKIPLSRSLSRSPNDSMRAERIFVFEYQRIKA